ncbi:MAG: SDR family NAD(P)-dependent oxidoreductase [Rubrobacteraceae bacterium]|jgi:NAD(P)-dependent dehydrogenase (short-subunit alcohol dehydrogenase family)
MDVERQRVALVTGSTSGIGAEIARGLVNTDARVVVTGRSEERGQAVFGETTGAGGEAVFVGHDLKEAASGFRISLVDLDVSGEVSGMSQEEFGKAVEESCPVSNAIRNNVEVRLRGPAVVDGG